MSPESRSGSLGAMPIDRFLDLLASSSPTPGGGGIAAMAGALAAGLISMVCNLTIGKEKYASVEADVKRLLSQSEELRARLHALVDADAQAYGRVMDTYRMPRNTDEEKRMRSAAIQEATIEASRVPLEIATACSAVLDLAGPAARLTNVQAIGDVAMAAYLAEGAVQGAVVNIDINLRPIKDRDAADTLSRDARALTAGLHDRVQVTIRDGLARL